MKKDLEFLKEVHTKIRVIYLLPFIGWFKYMSDTMKVQKRTPLYDKSTTSGQYMYSFMKKYMLVLNIFLPIFTIICIFLFNFAIFVWKKPVLKAISLAEDKKHESK